MARVALPKHEQITDPAVEGIFAWVTEMEGSVPNIGAEFAISF